MIVNFKQILFFLVMYFSLSMNVNAADKPLEFNQEQYKEHLKEYKYPRKAEEKIEQKKKSDNKIMPTFSQSLLSIIAWSIIIILIVGLLIYLIWKLIKSNVNYISETESDNIIRKVEENLILANLDSLIAKAIQAGNFELAIKLNYFRVLKSLVLKELIKYKKSKSNKEYLYEVFETPYYKNLRTLNNSFDRLRYSRIAISENEYNLFSSECSTFINLFK